MPTFIHKLEHMSFLWQLLRGCGGRYAPANVDYGEVAEIEVGKLDVVDKEIQGKANMKAMKDSLKCYPFAWRALMLITSFSFFIAEVCPPDVIRRVKTDERWYTIPTTEDNHVEQLKSFGLISSLASGLVLGVSKYFAVGKSDGSARSMFSQKM